MNYHPPLLIFYLYLRLDCTKIHQFVQYTPKKCFNSFVQSAVNAGRQGDENPNSSVVAETMKLLANISYGYQIMYRSRHTVTKYLNDEKFHSAINHKLFKRLNFITDQLYEVELVKSEIEHREPINEKQSTLLQPTKDFEQRNIALQPTNRQKRVCLIFTQNDL